RSRRAPRPAERARSRVSDRRLERVGRSGDRRRRRGLLTKPPRPVLVPASRRLQVPELLDALGAGGVAPPPGTPEPASERGLALATDTVDRRLDVRRLGPEEPLDLPPADADPADVAEAAGGAPVGEIGAQVERLLADGGGVFRPGEDADPLVERAADRTAPRTAIARARQLERPEHRDDAPDRASLAPHRLGAGRA